MLETCTLNEDCIRGPHKWATGCQFEPETPGVSWLDVDPVGSTFYQVTPSTGVVHKVPCIRNTTRRPLAWPRFYDDQDRACSHCLPGGLPEVGR